VAPSINSGLPTRPPSILATDGCAASSKTGTPKDVRLKAITIGGETVVELDINAMMPRLLYARVGQSYPADQDPYAILLIHEAVLCPAFQTDEVAA
jgi:hypothetical protein